MQEKNKSVALFDLNGTLTTVSDKIPIEIIETLKILKNQLDLGLVCGYDLEKILFSLGENLKLFDWIFAENGLYVMKNGIFLEKNSLLKTMGEEKMKLFTNFCLKYLSEIDIPLKRGTFFELRNSMINISPIGRNCSKDERREFEEYDKVHNIRQKFIEALKAKFDVLDLHYTVGGQISFDVSLKGWNKSYCLKFLSSYEDVYFFGDKTERGGNDYEIFTHERTKGYTVKDPDDTIKQVNKLFLNK